MYCCARETADRNCSRVRFDVGSADTPESGVLAADVEIGKIGRAFPSRARW